MASSSKYDIIWSPTKRDQFVAFGSEITRYKIEKIPTDKEILPGLKLSDDTHAVQISQNNEHQLAKCLAWYPNADKDDLIAVGLANGNITLSSLDQKKDSELIGKEYVPKHCRPCLCLAWSPDASPMLAAGLDKFRTDQSLLIWDLNRSVNEISHSSTDSHNASRLGKPYYDYGSSESTYSLAWVNPSSLIAGMNKYVRVIDLRRGYWATPTEQVGADYFGLDLTEIYDPHCIYGLYGKLELLQSGIAFLESSLS